MRLTAVGFVGQWVAGKYSATSDSIKYAV